MNSTLTTPTEEIQLTKQDRCDQCAAQAYVLVKGVSGSLYFCGHHYSKIIDNAVGYDKLHKFAYDIIDHRLNIG